MNSVWKSSLKYNHINLRCSKKKFPKLLFQFGWSEKTSASKSGGRLYSSFSNSNYCYDRSSSQAITLADPWCSHQKVIVQGCSVFDYRAIMGSERWRWPQWHGFLFPLSPWLVIINNKTTVFNCMAGIFFTKYNSRTLNSLRAAYLFVIQIASQYKRYIHCYRYYVSWRHTI